MTHSSIIPSFRDLIVWQKGMDIVSDIYRITQNFPPDEKHGLTNQIRRSAISIPSNIAEGKQRYGKAEFRQFLSIAYGSGAEVETQLEIAIRLGYCSKEECKHVQDLLVEMSRMLNVFMRKLKSSSTRSSK